MFRKKFMTPLLRRYIFQAGEYEYISMRVREEFIGGTPRTKPRSITSYFKRIHELGPRYSFQKRRMQE